MRCKWEEVTISKLVTIIGGGTPKTSKPEYWNGSINWISIADFNNENRYIDKTEKFITQTGLNNSSTKLLNKGDLIISARGTVGELGQLSSSMAFNQSCYGLSANNSTTNDFMYYAIKNIIRIVKNNVHGSVFDTVTKNTFDNLYINLPPIATQNKIAAILSSLDNKIENNRKTAEKLEEITQAIFKRWFVDFNFPDENGLPYKDSGGVMVESEMGEIPEGWKIGKLQDIGNIIGGSTPSRKKKEYYEKGNIPWITPKDLSGYNYMYINEGQEKITEEAYNSCSTKLIPTNSILYSSRAPIGYIAINSNDVCTNQGFKSIVPTNGYTTEYLYFLMKYLTPEIINQAGGSTFKEISGTVLKNKEIVISNIEICDSYTGNVNVLFKYIDSIEKETKILKLEREILLPKLMNGELEV